MASALAIVCIVICSIASIQAGYDYNALTDKCNSDPDQWIIYLGWNGASSYGVLQLMRGGDYGSNLNCSLKLVVPATYQLHIVVDRIDTYADSPYDCSPDYLEISNDVTLERYCGTSTVDKQLTMQQYAIIRFISDSTMRYNYDGFSLYYNLFRTTNGNCTDNEYECELNDRCILEELTCDTRNNCGDLSDEYCEFPGWGIFLIVLISLVVVGIIVVVAVFACCVGCCACCCCNKKKQSASDVHPQVYALNSITTTSEPMAVAHNVYQVPPPTYSEAAAAAAAAPVSDIKYTSDDKFVV